RPGRRSCGGGNRPVRFSFAAGCTNNKSACRSGAIDSRYHRVPSYHIRRTFQLCVATRRVFCAYSGQKKRGSYESMADHSPDAQRLLASAYRGLFLFSLLVVCAFNFADRAIFAVLAQTIRVDLRLTDFQLGLLQGVAFAAFYAIMGIPFGRLA